MNCYFLFFIVNKDDTLLSHRVVSNCQLLNVLAELHTRHIETDENCLDTMQKKFTSFSHVLSIMRFGKELYYYFEFENNIISKIVAF